MISHVYRAGAAVIVAVLLVIGGASSAQAASNQDGVYASVNAQRAAAGLPALKRNVTLDATAQAWAQQMSSVNSMVHSTSDWRAERIPSGWTTNGENIAYGYSAPSAVMSGWMNSKGHRDNILRSSYTHVGIGYVASGNFWVQIFAGYVGNAAPPTAPAAVAQKCPIPKSTNGTSAVYRFWSDTKQGHFYTISSAECDYILNNYPASVWKYEGIAYNTFAAPAAGTVPVYRFWSDTFQGHFYTASQAERDSVISEYPDKVWKYEQVAFNVYPTNYSGPSATVSRFWSDSKKHHFFTSSATERDAVIRDYPDRVWSFEGARFKVPLS